MVAEVKARLLQARSKFARRTMAGKDQGPLEMTELRVLVVPLHKPMQDLALKCLTWDFARAEDA